MSSKKRQQTFAKLKREQAVRERRERKQEAKKAARELKAAARRDDAATAENPPLEVENDSALAVAIDDPASGEVVGRKLDPHTITRQNPDSVPLEAAGHVAERLVAVVEAHTEHPAAESF